jgi:hypothetical protein
VTAFTGHQKPIRRVCVPEDLKKLLHELIEHRSREEGLEDDIKETYALYGVAYYFSEVLHRSLCTYDALRKFSPKGAMTRPRIDELMHSSYSLTLGHVAENLDGAFDPDLSKRLEEAVKHRNFLAHRFS